jgi:LDH2 family malate/lactate/ureidoglycolate dehydrogenase
VGGTGRRRHACDRRDRRGDRCDEARAGHRHRQVAAARLLNDEQVLARIRALGFSERDSTTLAGHFLDAERRGKLGHGLSRVDWLETLPDLNPTAEPALAAEYPGFEHWEGNGALGYLTLAAICERIVEKPPWPAKVITAAQCFPTGALGYWVRWIAEEAERVAILTATSPRRLAHPDGGPALVGTTPLAIGIPNPEGDPIVVDVSMGRATYGDVLAGLAREEELVPFGGDQAYKAFALALGLQLAVESCVVEGYGALLIVIAPETSTVPELRARAASLRLPGDR